MKRLLLAVVALSLVAACSDGGEREVPPTAVVAEVDVSLPGGAPRPVTHGNDPLPARPPSLVAQAPPEAPWPCEGTGTDGRRVQMLYVHGGTSNLGTLRPTLEAWTRQIEGMFLTSARETGAERLVRFVTGAGCSLSIEPVQVSANALGSFDQMIAELQQSGFNRNDRIYHSWVESNSYCGIGTVYTDDKPTGNINEQYAQFSRTDRPCWNANVAAHEIVHNLGGVQNSAPNSTGGLHCRDERDNMCYPDGAPKGQMVTVCPDAIGEDRLDCGKNDYFSTSPLGGSYLATHWNTANASALSRGAPPTTAPPPIPTTTTSTTLPPTTTTTVGKGDTDTELTLPSQLRSGVPFVAEATVTGDCNPGGTIAFYVSGKLMSRQVVVNGRASVTLTVITSVDRPTFRADYSGNERCSTSRDTVRRRVS